MTTLFHGNCNPLTDMFVKLVSSYLRDGTLELVSMVCILHLKR